jgi:hypothetical protein
MNLKRLGQGADLDRISTFAGDPKLFLSQIDRFSDAVGSGGPQIAGEQGRASALRIGSIAGWDQSSGR